MNRRTCHTDRLHSYDSSHYPTKLNDDARDFDLLDTTLEGNVGGCRTSIAPFWF